MLGVVDPKPETIVLEPKIVVPRPKAAEVVAHYNYKNSGTQDVAKVHMCWHQKPGDMLLDS